MSEYWKSTPRYWCKFCKTYVKDTKLERQQHEATGRHQGSIQRSLRNLHRESEREERDKQRAKDEVARLNGIVSGTASQSAAGKSSSPKSSHVQSVASSAPPAKVSLEERKTQMKQLAEMGVSIPDEFRGDLALAGEWQTVSVRNVGKSDDKSDRALSYGVRKRKIEGNDVDDDENESKVDDDGNVAKRRADWGSRYRSYNDASRGATSTNDIETLLGQKADQKPASQSESKDLAKLPGESPSDHDTQDQLAKSEATRPDENPSVAEAMTASAPDNEDANDAAPVVFKKRKSKAAKVK